MKIAITGEGIISAIGIGKEQTLSSLKAGRSGIGEMRYLQSVHHELPVGEVPLSNDEMRQMLGIEGSQLVSRCTLMGCIAIREAMAQAGLSEASDGEGPVGARVLLSGTTVGGMDITEQCFGKAMDTDAAALSSAVDDAALLDALRHHDGGSQTQQMADFIGGFADCTTISTACSSAANAIAVGAELLKTGQADIVVAGGTEALTRFHLNGFNALMILDHEPCRPFDKTRAGLNLGEGAAFLVMETEEHARQRGATIDAFLAGYGNACDAFHQTASSDNGEGAYRAMTEALQMAGITPAAVDYICAHGTGTPNNDQSESVALHRVFDDPQTPEGSHSLPPIGSNKSFTGHTTSACGAISAVTSILAMQHHFIPANLNWHTPMDNGIIPTMGQTDIALHYVLCNAFGFGGNDSALVFSSQFSDFSEEPPAINHQPSTINQLARVDLTSASDLSALKRYVKPMQLRRMGKLLKASLLASLQALEQAGIDKPDAIITGTAYGCLDNSEQILVDMLQHGEHDVSPTRFMQSTHNTIGSALAIYLHCHGYNITYTQGDRSLDWALRDARMLLEQGRAHTVLVGMHDESSPIFHDIVRRLTGQDLPTIHSTAIVLSKG